MTPARHVAGMARIRHKTLVINWIRQVKRAVLRQLSTPAKTIATIARICPAAANLSECDNLEYGEWVPYMSIRVLCGKNMIKAIGGSIRIAIIQR